MTAINIYIVSNLWLIDFFWIRCYNCGDFGNHIASKCPHGPLPKRCHSCKSTEHLIADCPLRDPSLPVPHNGDGNGNGNGLSPWIHVWISPLVVNFFIVAMYILLKRVFLTSNYSSAKNQNELKYNF